MPRLQSKMNPAPGKVREREIAGKKYPTVAGDCSIMIADPRFGNESQSEIGQANAERDRPFAR
jgi:hypothetical protein